MDGSDGHWTIDVVVIRVPLFSGIKHTFLASVDSSLDLKGSHCLLLVYYPDYSTEGVCQEENRLTGWKQIQRLLH